MSQNVKFFFTSDLTKYQKLAVKDPLALYFIEDANTGFKALYKGESLIATGSEASQISAGLMSASDKKNLDDLVASGGLDKLVPVNGSIVIADGADGKKNIEVGVSTKGGNALSVEADGLFVNAPIEFSVEKQAVADSGFAATYKLKRIENGVETYEGDPINIPQDKVLQSAEMKTVDVDGQPYPEAKIGDEYIDMAFNDAAQSHIYVPLGDINKDVKVNITIDNANANGLSYVDGSGLALALASATSNGAMSKEMFAATKSLLDADIINNYATKTEITALANRITVVEDSYTWGELT